MHRPHFCKTILVLAIFIAFCSTTLHADTKGEKKDSEFAATVNGVRVSLKDFNRSVAAARQQFATIGNQPGEEGEVNVKKEVLDRLIDFELMLQDSEKRGGIVVTDGLVEENFRGFAKRFETEEAFNQYIEKNNYSVDEMRAQIRRSIIMRQYQLAIRDELTATVTISDQQVKEFYDKNPDKFKQPEQVRVSHILIGVDPKADAAAAQKARTEIEEIEKKVKAGEDFAELARANSTCPSSAKGGDLGFFAKGRMVPPFEEAAFALKPGEISPIVETQFGYHLIKMEEKKDAGTVPFDEVKTRIRDYLSQTQLDLAQQKYIKGLRDKAEIAILIPLD